MGQGLWRVARNQQLQQEGYSEQGYLSRDQSRRMAANNISNTSHRKQVQGGIDIYHLLKARKSKEQEGFINLEMLPPELSFTILSYLNATDLCLASCVWQDLANDELLWQGLCKSTWGHCSIYNKNPPLGFSFRKLYMQLDEGSLTFNANPEEGVNYFMSKGILDDSPKEIAKFIFCTRTLNWKKLRIYLDERRDVLDDLVTLHNFRNQFLPNALREFFRHIHAPEERGEYLETLITKFSHRFCACNPDLMRELGLSPDAVYVLCYSLILLSIDLTSPHVKNKMSKREFIRNTRRAAQNISEDFVGHLYDNIYLMAMWLHKSTIARTSTINFKLKLPKDLFSRYGGYISAGHSSLYIQSSSSVHLFFSFTIFFWKHFKQQNICLCFSILKFGLEKNH
uniref:F-box only protein 8 n=1 Tax=Canis lupus familiaris TaxID=9615 RepID=A0A8C0TE22_CANLF